MYCLVPKKCDVKFSFQHPGFMSVTKTSEVDLTVWRYELDSKWREAAGKLCTFGTVVRKPVPTALVKEDLSDRVPLPTFIGPSKDKDQTEKERVEKALFVKQWPCKHLFF